MRMKLCSNHMRRRVSLYVLYRTEGKNQVAELVTLAGLFWLLLRRYFPHSGQNRDGGTELLVVGKCIFLLDRLILQQRDPCSAIEI